MDDLTPLAPDESLYAFMDGELDPQNEQSLFDALASDRTLRTEMKDILSIRNAVHRDLLFPSPDAESGMLAATGLATPAVTTAPFAAKGLWAALAPLAYTAGGLLAGAVVMFMVMRDRDIDRVEIASAPAPSTMQMEMPVAGRAAASSTSTVPTRVIYVYRDRQPAAVLAATPAAPTMQTEASPVTDVAATPVATLSAQQHLLGGRTESIATPERQFALDRMTPTHVPVQLRLRALPSGVPSDEATPASIREAFLPNTALALTFPLGSQHRVGLEMAQESFRQVFNGTFDGRPVTFTQTPTLFWMGATYQYTPMEFSFLEGLRPYAELTAAVAFDQGPLAQGAVGLSYTPVGPLSFNLGVNAAALFFQNEQAWYSSTKWGLTYGLSVDLGRLR